MASANLAHIIGNLRRQSRLAAPLLRVLRQTAFARFPNVSLHERLAMVPTYAPGLTAPITIRWSRNHVPFVDAQCEADAAVGLGIVHGHLRLTQLELMRRAANGTLSEVAGPAAVEADKLLRLIDFPRATETSLAMMPAATRQWVQGFANGINAVASHSPPPPELRLLGIDPQPWTPQDLFAISRLCSADYAWRVWRALGKLRQREGWPGIWQAVIGEADGETLKEDVTVPPELGDLTTMFTKAGSNAFAIAGSHTESGAPILACDPHHLIMTPTLWLIAGYRTPSTSVWGLMIPGLPIFAPARNEFGAWGGTNLHATSSELVDVSDEPLEQRQTRIRVRGGGVRQADLRESRFGPVISDTSAFALPSETVALTWMGHRPSDDFTAFRAMANASSWDQFLDALDSYSLPGLNMIWAGKDDTIGKAVAAKIPKRPLTPPADMVTEPIVADAHWADVLTAKALPVETDPASGILVSANEAPTEQAVTISLYFAADHRFERLTKLLGTGARWTLSTASQLFFDVYHAPSLTLSQAIVARADRLGLNGAVCNALADWDGNYAQDSAGALAFALTAHGLLEQLEPTASNPAVSQFWRPFDRLRVLVNDASDDDLNRALPAVLELASRPFHEHGVWGNFHTMSLAHPLSRLPWLRRRLSAIAFPIGGSNDTVQKAMHAYSAKASPCTFGQNARFIADLSDEDATFASILGGQDGWPGSQTLFDQVDDWRGGRMIQLPFSDDALKRDFPHLTAITPRNA
ncbi:MAG: penicillin acylase family protein [Pseudomonadota bacterium]